MAHWGKYVARKGRQSLPSPSMGEGQGGGESEDEIMAVLPPILTFPPRGEGTCTYPCQPPQGGEAVPQPYRVGMPQLRMRRIQVLPRRQMSQTHGAAIRDLRCGVPRHGRRVMPPAEGVAVLR